MSILRQARRSDLDWVWPAAKAGLLFDDAVSLQHWWEEAPWRVQVSLRGEAVVLARWREHMDILSMRAVWCSNRRLSPILPELREVAVRNGLHRLLSPLLPAEATRPYTKAGMVPIDQIIVMRVDLGHRRGGTQADSPEGVHVRAATEEDLEPILSLDGEAFPEFWRYDPALVEEYSSRERLAVAEAEGGIVGYTLSTIRRGIGSIGRLAVQPEHQGRGIGRLLLEDSLSYLGACGAEQVTLCTQSDNERSQRLYSHAGFEKVPGTLLGLISEPF